MLNAIHNVLGQYCIVFQTDTHRPADRPY